MMSISKVFHRFDIYFKGFLLQEEEYSQYQVELGKYLTGLPPLISRNFGRFLVWLITTLSLPCNWLL